MDTAIHRQPLRFFSFARSVLLPLALGLGLFYLLIRPTMQDFTIMMALMGATSLVSLFVAYAAYRFGWINRLPYIRWMLMSIYAFSGLLVFLNVWVIARMMFASEHDLLLATVLLVFASGIAMTLGFLFSEALTDRIVVLNHAARRLAFGRLETRVPVSGRDEMAGLASAFNEMATQLQRTEQKQRELDALRRDLIAWVGHDLRTPLTSIRAILEALADGVVDDPETVQRYLRTAQSDIRALSLLIDDLFEMSQIDAGGLKLERSPNSIADLISDTLESFTELAVRQNVMLEGRAAPDSDPVNMDAARVGRALANLVSNSLRYTPAGGRVEIEAARIPGGLLVEVIDTGEGIKSEDLPHIFDRFYRGEKSRSRDTGGAGLGLAIARGIIEAHGGKISVESLPGFKTTFRFTLPD